MFLLNAGRAAAAAESSSGGVLSISSNNAVISYNVDAGTFDLRPNSGGAVLLKAHAVAVIAAGKEKNEISFAGAKKLISSSSRIKDEFGAGKEIRITLPGAGGLPDVNHIIRAYNDKGYFIIYMEIVNKSGKPVWIDRVSPVSADKKEGGAVFPGTPPSSLLILENGHKNRFDFWVRLIRATGEADSNWSAAIYDLDTGRALVGGFLTQENSLGSVLANPGESSAEGAKSGVNGLGLYTARAAFSPLKRLEPGARLVTDAFFVQFAGKDALSALETFGRAAATANHAEKLSKVVPAFWDTWYSHHYVNIDEEIILRNLDAVAEKLQPYGMNTFELDAGWQDDASDWLHNKERFPRGMKYIADKIKAKGLSPAIWLAPFMENADTPACREHPDWFLEMATYGKTLMPKDKRALDVSNPEAQKWLREVIGRVAREWGFDILKVDFTYWSLEGKSYFQTGRSRTELFREAYRIIKDAAGPGKRILAVGVPVGYHAGIVDYMRTGLDNSPRWGTESGYATQGTLPSFRSMIRRYFLNGAVWMNDPDDVYTGYGPTSNRWNQPPQPRNELLAWISAVGLTGQMVELADEPASIGPENLALIRSIIPVYRAGARPVDLFLKEHPEILDLKVDSPEQWHVVGLFNWGENKTTRGEELSGEREVGFDFKALGLPAGGGRHIYDFWEQKYLGEYKDGYKAKLAPRSVRVVSVHRALGRPQFLASNRHITMGATDIERIDWNDKSKTLSGTQGAVAGFEYRLAFYLPNGYKLKSAKAGDGEPRTVLSDGGRILNLYFTPRKSGEFVWKLVFEKRK